MATHKSALKRARQSEERRLRNMTYRNRAKRAVREVRTAVADNAGDQAKESLKKATSILQKTASRGVIPRKRAARKISRLARQVNRIAAPQQPQAVTP